MCNIFGNKRFQILMKRDIHSRHNASGIERENLLPSRQGSRSGSATTDMNVNYKCEGEEGFKCGSWESN